MCVSKVRKSYVCVCVVLCDVMYYGMLWRLGEH